MLQKDSIAAHIFLSIAASILVGISLSGALLVFVLISMLERYSKDLAEVLACWQYITISVVITVIAGVSAFRAWAGR